MSERILTGRPKFVTPYKSASKAIDPYYVFDVNTVCDVYNPLAMAYSGVAGDINYLMQYVRGRQDIYDRVKTVRPDIDNKVVINHASEITRNLVGYAFGKPIKYVPRQAGKRSAVKKLNEYTANEDKFTSDQELATQLSVCGIGYRGVFHNAYAVDDDNPFVLQILDPRTTFVVYASDFPDMPVMACTYYLTNPDVLDSNESIVTIYTHDMIYRFRTGDYCGISAEQLISVEVNPLGEIPIVEYENNSFRMGDWETSISLMNALNTVASDSVNDVSQFVQSILVAVNAEFTDEAIEQLKANKIVSIYSSRELPADLKYIAEQTDADNVTSLREFLLEQLEIVTGLPSRNTSSSGGGDTGDAVYLRDGYENLEVVARIKESFFRKGERETLALIIKWLGVSNKGIPLTVNNVDIKFTRNSTDNLLTKANALSILNGTKLIAPTDAIALVGITTEPDELAQRGEEYWDKKNQELMNQQNQMKNNQPENPQNPDNASRDNNQKRKTDRE